MNNVSTLPGVVIASDRRALFLNEIAAAFDHYVADYGVEPEAYVGVLGGIKQTARVSWTMQGETAHGTSTMLALAAAVVTKELVNPG